MIAALIGLTLAQDGASGEPAEGLGLGCLFPTRVILKEGGGTWRFRAGRPTIVLFVAYWCDTWKDMRASVAQVQREPWTSGVDWVVISTDGRWGELGQDWKQVLRLKDTGQQWTTGQITKVPTCLAVAATGAIVARQEGTLSAQGMRRVGTLARQSLRR